jgi:glycerol-3-phosphate dehydrogenase
MSTASAALNVARRRAELLRAAEDVTDLLVVGGGITGVGVALDAAARGLSVTLIEAEDLAFGTSRFSSKLVHGGLR